MCVCPYRKRLEPLLDDKSLHQVSQDLSSLGPRPRLPRAVKRLAEALGLIFRLAKRRWLGLGLSRVLRLLGRFDDFLRLVLHQSQVCMVEGLSGEEGGRVFCRRGDEG